MKSKSDGAPGNAGRWVLVLLAAAFFLPVVGAIALFQSGWRPQSQINHGELVLPARPLTDITLTTLDGGRMTLGQPQQKWTMIYFGSANCAARCQRQLYRMRQVHVAQGPESDRVRRVFIATDAGALDALQKDYPNMQFLTGTADNIRRLAAQFQLPVGSPLDDLGRVYLVDPAGNFMMSYPADAEGEGMRRDLVRLLKISKTD